VREVLFGVVSKEVQDVSLLYSVDEHGVVTFCCRPADDEERGVFATLKARAADVNARRRVTGETSEPAAQSSTVPQE